MKNSTFEERRQDWERRIEDILVEVHQEKNDQGIPFGINVSPVVEEFTRLMTFIENARTSSVLILRPGNTANEE